VIAPRASKVTRNLVVPGGIAFLVGGAMCVGVDKDDLILRCEKEQTEAMLTKRGVRPFDLSGKRPMQGWLLVGPDATKTAAGFRSWIDFALEWTKKAAKAPAKRRAKRRASAK
jgi:hypothetical protein